MSQSLKNQAAVSRMSDNQLVDVIKSGSLLNAAARHELESRGRTMLLRAAIDWMPSR